jgi:hypothetical protein
MHGVNTHDFRWIFTPPAANDKDDDFRDFIGQFLTTQKAISISLKIKTISVVIAGHQVVLNGLEIHTTVKGTGQSLISRVDVYLGFQVLCREVTFRFKLGVLSFTCKLRC